MKDDGYKGPPMDWLEVTPAERRQIIREIDAQEEERRSGEDRRAPLGRKRGPAGRGKPRQLKKIENLEVYEVSRSGDAVTVKFRDK